VRKGTKGGEKIASWRGGGLDLGRKRRTPVIERDAQGKIPLRRLGIGGGEVVTKTKSESFANKKPGGGRRFIIEKENHFLAIGGKKRKELFMYQTGNAPSAEGQKKITIYHLRQKKQGSFAGNTNWEEKRDRWND